MLFDFGGSCRLECLDTLLFYGHIMWQSVVDLKNHNSVQGHPKKQGTGNYVCQNSILN